MGKLVEIANANGEVMNVLTVLLMCRRKILRLLFSYYVDITIYPARHLQKYLNRSTQNDTFWDPKLYPAL